MTPDERLIEAVRTVNASGVPQRDIASQALMSQPHLSKLLRRQVPLTARAREKLRAALRGFGQEPHEPSIPTLELERRLQALPSHTRDRIAAALIEIVEAVTATDNSFRGTGKDSPGE